MKSVHAAEIQLKMPSNIGKNHIFQVQVFLDTKQKQTIGTDLLVSYDQNDVTFLRAQESDFYKNYHQAKVFQDRGHIRFSGTSNYGEYIEGKGLFATLIFRKKQLGKPQISLIWEKNRTDDTNVIGIDGSDLLSTAPSTEYDNSLRVPQSNGQEGVVLGEEIDQDGLNGISQQGFVMGEATRVKQKSWWWLIVIIVLIVVAINLYLRYKRKI